MDTDDGPDDEASDVVVTDKMAEEERGGGMETDEGGKDEDEDEDDDEERVPRMERLQAKYELTAVVHHLGRHAFAGHYITSVKKPEEASSSEKTGAAASDDGQTWTEFNDSITMSRRESAVLQKAQEDGYIFFFRAVQEDAKEGEEGAEA